MNKLFFLLIVCFLFSTCSYQRDSIVVSDGQYTIRVYNKSLARPKELVGDVEEKYNEHDYRLIKLELENNRKNDYFILHDSILYARYWGEYKGVVMGPNKIRPAHYLKPNNIKIEKNEPIKFYMLYEHILYKKYCMGTDTDVEIDSLTLFIPHIAEKNLSKTCVLLKLYFNGHNIIKAVID